MFQIITGNLYNNIIDIQYNLYDNLYHNIISININIFLYILKKLDLYKVILKFFLIFFIYIEL